MKHMHLKLCCLVIMGPLIFGYQAHQASHTVEVVRQFVQGFYDWYVHKAVGGNSGEPWDLAVKEKQSSFSSELALALRQDSEAQAKTNGEIAGLDFDPFLNTQDPGTQYNVGQGSKRGENYWVSVYEGPSYKKSSTPTVFAEVSYRGGRWRFIDFRYPDGRDLFTILETLKRTRGKPSDR